MGGEIICPAAALKSHRERSRIRNVNQLSPTGLGGLEAMRKSLGSIGALSIVGLLVLLPCHGKQREPNPQTESSSTLDLAVRTMHRRAIEAIIWGMPAVNYDLMYQAAVREANGGFNQIIYWSRLPDWKNQTLTPNPDAIYFMPFVNTKDVGPMVLEIPPADEGSITGTVMDVWQCALEDVGPAGVDKGKGGKYLILPPGYNDKVPAGYIPMPSDTYEGYALLRSIPKSGSDANVAKAVAYGKRIKLYPLSQAPQPPVTTFVDVVDVVYDSTITYDLRFFESLNRIVQLEPWLERDKAMIDQLKSIGIEKGKPFNPDQKTLELLNDAAREAHVWLVAQYEASFLSPYYEGGHWARPGSRELFEGQATFFAKPDVYPVDVRGVTFSYAYFTPKHLGTGSSYLLCITDKDGRLLDGSATYRLTVPANVPVTQYWSATVYDRATHAPIRNAQWPSRSSNTPGLQKNSDGSVDIYFGPKASAGKETNWVPTSTGGGFEVLFRFYGPEKPLFDKTWKLPDIEKMGEPAVRTNDSDDHDWIGTETVKTRFADFDFKNGYPTPEATEKLYELRTFNRAVESYLHFVTIMSMFYMQKGLNEFGLDAANKFLIFEKMDAQSLFLTPNSESVYGMQFLDLKRDGPTIVEVPPGLLGGFSNMWQQSLIGIGPTAADKGKGGRFLLLPPDYKAAPPADYFSAKSPTYDVWLGVRGFLVDGKADQSIALMKTTRIYPLAKAADPPAMIFLNGSGKAIDTIFPDTYEYFENLAALVEKEPVDAISPSDRFLLASIGIEKGKSFTPDTNTKQLLEEAARAGAAMARANTFASRDPMAKVYPDRLWEWAFVGGSASWDAKGYVNIDNRAAWNYAATGNSPAMVQRTVASGSQYLMATRDTSGAFLDGGKNYRLHLPPNVPVKLFWSIVVYDALSRSELQNGEQFPSVSQYTGPVANGDGSMDIYFGPQAPEGKGKNWIRTVEGKGWFLYLRFYSPTEAFFDQTWKPDDIVEVNS